MRAEESDSVREAFKAKRVIGPDISKQTAGTGVTGGIDGRDIDATDHVRAPRWVGNVESST